MKISVVILNWNGIHFLKKLLPGVVQNSDGAEIVIADNGSTDESVDWVRKNQPTVKVVEIKKNLGFSEGYNYALAQIEADYYVLLNSDVEVTPGWLTPIIAGISSDPLIGACQPKILSYGERHRFEYAGAAGGFMDKNGFVFCRGRMFNTFERDENQYDDQIEVFWATGCCICVNAKLYHELGGLDKDFFAHMEEIDLCWRMKNMGYKIMYFPNSVVYHIGGGTLSRINPRKTFLNFRNNLFLLVKNYHSGNLPVKLFFRSVLDFIAGLKFLSEGNAKHAWAVVKAHYYFYKNLNLMLSKRKRLKEKVITPNITGLYNRNVVFDYFLNRKRKFSELDKKYFVHSSAEEIKNGKTIRF